MEKKSQTIQLSKYQKIMELKINCQEKAIQNFKILLVFTK